MINKFKDYLFRRLIGMGKAEDNLGKYYDLREIEENINIYEGKPTWDGKSTELNIGASVASEIARRATIEFESKIDDVKGSEHINKSYQKLVKKTRETTEKLLAQGNLILKPYVDTSTSIIAVEVVNSRKFIPLRFNSLEEMTAVSFIDVIKIGEKAYTRLETHDYDEASLSYTITNRAYLGEGVGYNGKTGDEVRLDIYEGWADLEPEITIENISRPLFVHMKTPYSNNVDIESPLGVSVFSKIKAQLRDANRVYNDFIHDIKIKRLKIAVPLYYLKDPQGNQGLADTMDGMDNVFMKLNTVNDNGDHKDLISIFNPELRVNDYTEAMEAIYRKIEFNAGLAYGDLSNVNSVDKTAEEIKSSKERSWSTVVDIQKQIEKSYKDVIRVMYIYLILYTDVDYGEVTEELDNVISFHFDDSMIVDKKYELDLMMKEVEQGILSKREYLKRRYGVTDEEAAIMLEDPILG